LLRHPFQASGPIIYSIQRHNRDYPGIAIVKKPDGTFLRRPDGSLFFIAQLARSLSSLPGYLTNGNTPQGVFSIQGLEESNSDFIGPTLVLKLALAREVSLGRFFHNPALRDTSWTMEKYARSLPPPWRDYAPMHEAFYAGLAGRSEILCHGTALILTIIVANHFIHIRRPWLPDCVEAWSNQDGRRLISDQQALIEAYQAAGGSGGFFVVVDKDNQAAAVDWREIIMEVLAAEGW